jgi:hypothetical protein
MYTTCIYCHKPLGSNQVIEPFPVGRRLAFDAAKGRLWVVCRACERWNLSPLETRWEAIEECERAFGATRLRVSTDNIGLARLHEGLELVRIGAPQRPEMAAWRYGDQFGRRRRKAFVIGGGVVVAVGAVVAGASAAGIGIGGLGGLWGNIPNIINSMRVVRLRTDAGRLLKIRGTEFTGARLQPSPETGEARLSIKHKRKILVFEGQEALRHTARLLPAINAAGGSRKTVQEAVHELEYRRGPEGFLEALVPPPPTRSWRAPKPRSLSQLAAPTRLALEMALHEEAERRAIEGELALLEEAWREAEEIAAISDSLFLPAEVDQQLAELKRRAGPGERESTP